MLPKWHILIGFVFSYILVYFFNFSLAAGTIIFISSWLIVDSDHYLRYFFITKSFSLIGFWKWSAEEYRKHKLLSCEERKKSKKPILIFHGIEFWLILAGLGFISPIFLWILLGVGVHMVADWIDLVIKKEAFCIKSSIIVTLKNNSLLKENQ